MQIVIIFFAIVACIFEAFFWLISLVWFFIQVILFTFITIGILRIFKRYQNTPFSTMFCRIALRIMSIVGVFLGIFLAWIVYQNSFPGKLADITISNGKQTVVFLQMSHIGEASFYQEKQKQIGSLSHSGYTILVEWVLPGSTENEKKFNQALSFRFTPTLYDTLAKSIDMVAQDNTTLYTLASSGSLQHVDISIDDIMAIVGTGEILPLDSDTPYWAADIETDLQSLLTWSLDAQLLLKYSARAFLNFNLKHDLASGLVEQWGGDRRLWDAILVRRNDPIIRYIVDHPDQNIAVVYGALHFEWVFSGLLQHDPHWKIIRVDPTMPYW